MSSVIQRLQRCRVAGVLAQLCIRLVQGADFFARFYIYTPGGADLRSSPTAVWYEADCIVTNVSVTVPAGSAIESSIDFVTTGKFKLLIGGLPSYVLTEEPAKLLQEDGSAVFSCLHWISKILGSAVRPLMPDTEISRLAELPANQVETDDVLAIVDTSASETKKIKATALVNGLIDDLPPGSIDPDKIDWDTANPNVIDISGCGQN